MADIIKFNVGDRGRTHRGKERNFDKRALAAVVNSPETQERVRNRDMLGYYGHWQRAKFGMIPPETALIGGRVVNIEPAIVTTYLRADSDGNIEHTTEFLDTAAGKIAARMHRSKTGGFSSAINAQMRGGLDVPNLFGGFDYVAEPNYTTNRGYMFDSAEDVLDDGVIFDCVMQDVSQSNVAMVALYDSLQSDHHLALETVQKLMEEREELMSMLVNGGQGMLLDGVSGSRPALLSKQATMAFTQRAASFKTASLAGLERLPDEKDESADDATLDAARARWGIAK